MSRFVAIAAALAMAALVGCSTPTAQSWYRNEWRGFSCTEAREYLHGIRNVFLVCITEDHVEDLDPAKPASWSVLCFEGTVVRSYKGDWRVGEKIRFAHALDSTVEKRSNTRIGELVFLFTDVHTNTEFGVETGEFEKYRPETDRLLKSLFPEQIRD